jgi:hypothetical protein
VACKKSKTYLHKTHRLQSRYAKFCGTYISKSFLDIPHEKHLKYVANCGVQNNSVERRQNLKHKHWRVNYTIIKLLLTLQPKIAV